MIWTCDQTFLSPDWSRKGGNPFPPPFHFPGFGFSGRTQNPRCTGVPAWHWSFHTTGPSIYMRGLHPCKVCAIFLSASHIFLFFYFLHVCHVEIGSDTVLQIFCQDNLEHSTWYHIFVMPHQAVAFIRWVEYCSRMPRISHASLCRFLVSEFSVCLQLKVPSVCLCKLI